MVGVEVSDDVPLDVTVVVGVSVIVVVPEDVPVVVIVVEVGVVEVVSVVVCVDVRVLVRVVVAVLVGVVISQASNVPSWNERIAAFIAVAASGHSLSKTATKLPRLTPNLRFSDPRVYSSSMSSRTFVAAAPSVLSAMTSPLPDGCSAQVSRGASASSAPSFAAHACGRKWQDFHFSVH